MEIKHHLFTFPHFHDLQIIFGILFCTFILTSPSCFVQGQVQGHPIPTTQSPKFDTPKRTCKSIEVRQLSDFELLKTCTHILGYVRIVYPSESLTGYETPDITTEVREITDYLLVYRSYGLQTLANIFPKLQIIRGSELLFDEFSLVIYENRELNNLGLGSLIRIQAGNIRIESNPSLCYVETVNWVQLLGNSSLQHFYHKNNKPNNHCPLCYHTSNELVVEDELPEYLRHYCWNIDMMQRRPPTVNPVNCSSECGIRGCDDNGECCDNNCLNGCHSKHCTLCGNFYFSPDCVDKCPPNYYLYEKRDCFTLKGCRDSGGIPHDGICMDKCPKYHIINPNVYKERSCDLICAGNFTIHTSEDIESLKGCITINGSLTIELNDIKVKVPALENAFKNVTEITGYLKVVNSPQLLSLHFLPNLISIHGKELFDDLYAFYVVDNYHLSELWTPKQEVTILNGTIYFHLNPRLCPDKIYALQNSLKNAKALNNVNVSPHSNGERVICNSYLDELNATVEDYNSTAVRIKIDPFTTDNIQVILGYVYLIKEAPIKNVTLFDGRHGCGHDDWRMVVNPTKNVRFIISKLKPYTQYAYFVKTLTMTDYHIQVDAYSKINYFRTLPSKPGPVSRVHYTPIAAEKVIIHWWPPRKPNGVIEKYLINYYPVILRDSNFTSSQHPEPQKNLMDCECEEKNFESSGPLPADENFYSRAKLVYEETLPNLLYVKVGDKTRVHREVTPLDCIGNANCDGRLPYTPNNRKARWNTITKRIRRKRKISSEMESKKISVSKNDKKKTTDGTETDDDHDLEGDSTLAQAIRNFNRFRKQQEEMALKAQDTGPGGFQIIKSRPVCPIGDTSIQNNCQPLEVYEGIEVLGHIHSHRLTRLEANQYYRVSVRACAAHLKNGCGPQTTIFMKTPERTMQEFVGNIE